MTCGVMFYCYAQVLRQVTAARLLPLSAVPVVRLAGRRATLPAGSAVTELRPRHGRDWRKPGNMQNPAYSMPFAVAGINDKSATVIDRDDDKPTCRHKDFLVCENLLIRSIKNYHKLKVSAEDRAGFIAAVSAAARLYGARGGFCQRGIPFHVYIPL